MSIQAAPWSLLTPIHTHTHAAAFGLHHHHRLSAHKFPLLHRRHRSRLVFLVAAADSSPPSAGTIVLDDEFTLAKVSFGVIGLALGCTLLSYGFGAYFTILPGSEWSALMLTYGFPLAIIGMALKKKRSSICGLHVLESTNNDVGVGCLCGVHNMDPPGERRTQLCQMSGVAPKRFGQISLAPESLSPSV